MPKAFLVSVALPAFFAQSNDAGYKRSAAVTDSKTVLHTAFVEEAQRCHLMRYPRGDPDSWASQRLPAARR